MKKTIFLFALISLCVSTVFSQYTILQKKGDPVDVLGVVRNTENGMVLYATDKTLFEINYDDIVMMIDKDGNDVEDYSRLPKYNESGVATTTPQKKQETPASNYKPASTSEPAQYQQQQSQVSHQPQNNSSQFDLLIYKNGNTSKVHILRATTTSVIYTHLDDNQNVYTEQIQNLQSIVYENGEVEYLGNLSRNNANNNSSDECTTMTENYMEVMCKDLQGSYSWSEAKRVCPQGYHLPNVDEFINLCEKHSLEYRKSNSNINLYGEEYWTSSTNRKDKPYSVTTDDCEKEARDADKPCKVRCVKY